MAFVYSGNGPQWFAMGRDLMAASPQFRQAMVEVDDIFRAREGWSLIEELQRPEADARMALTEVAQPTLFALQVALTMVLRQAGVTEHAVFGHSVGEAAAAWASGALTLEQATDVIIHRSAMQARTAGRGKMAAIGVGPDEARAAMEQAGGWLELAAINGPRAVTVAGDPASLERLRAALTASGKFARVLPLDYAFHSQAMDPIEAELRSRLAHLTPAAERVPFVSTVEGSRIPGDSLDAEYWWRNIRAPVQFQAAAEHAVRDLGITVFVEIGPHPVLRDYVLQCAKALDRPVSAIATLRRPATGRPESDEANFQLALCTCHSLGATDVTATYERPTHPVALPTYPWQRTRHWRGHVPLPDMYAAIERVHPLLGWQPPGTEGVWRSALDIGMLPYLADHVVQDSALFPAAGHIELGLAAAGEIMGGGPIEIENFEIVRPLVVTALPITALMITVDAADGIFDVRSRPDVFTGTWTTHAKGRLTKIEGAPAAPLELDALRAGLPIAVTGSTHYDIATRRGLAYGPYFQGVRTLHLSAPDSPVKQAVAEIEVTADIAGYRSHPTVLDSALQVLITLLGRTEQRLCAYIPIQVESVRSFAPLPGRVSCHVAITRESDRSGSADIAVCDPSGTVLLQLRGARFRKVDFKQGSATPLLTEVWRPDPATAPLGLSVSLPSPTDLVFVETSASDDRETVEPAFDKLLGAYAAETLLALGAREPGATLVQIQRKNRIMPAQAGLLRRLLEWAEAEAYLRREGTGFVWRDDAPTTSAASLWRDLFLAHPSHSAELILAARYGEQLVSILRDGPPEASDRGDAPMEQLQDGAPTRAKATRVLQRTLTSLLQSWPLDRPVRIVELSGGSGGLAAALLPLLPGARTDYVFADTSAAALDRAEQRFAPFPFLRTKSFDATRPLDEQDGAPQAGAFDVVIAGATLGGRAGSPQLLANAHALLAPGGWLIVVEPGASRLEIMLQSLASPRLEPADADAMRDAGFEDVATPADGLMIAQRNSTAIASPLPGSGQPSRTMLLLAGTAEAAFAALLSDALHQRGMAVEILEVSSDGTAAWLDRPADDIVHLAGLAGPGADGSDALMTLQNLRVLAALNLVQAIKAAPTPLKPTLRFVTHGAFAGAAQTGPLDPGQAPLWGFGRVLANEYPDLAPRLVDLHATLDAASASLLADELLRTDEEMEVQLMAGQRFVARMQPTTETQFAAEADQRSEQAAAPFRLDFAGHGGIDSLVTRAFPRVPPAPGQVELRVLAAGLNFRDVLWTMGMLPEEAVEHGFSGPTIGMECAGEVIAIGDGVTGLSPGDRVVAFASSTFSSHVTTDAGAVVRIPDGITAAQAATIPTTFLTAWYALDYLARLRPGERVLIHGAAGGVGLAAVQIAKLRGAEVFGTAGSDEKRRVLRLLGVDHVLNSRSLAFADDVMRITGGKGVDVVLNSLAGEAITKNLGLLKPFGRFLEIGKRDLYANSRIGLRPFRNNLSYFGIDADTLLVERAELARELFAEVIALFAEGKLRPLPHTAFPVARAGEAFRLMQQSRHIGKIVLTMDEAASPVTAIDTALALKADGTYLVTGGLGGFGLATAKWLVAQGAGAVALLSRRGPQTNEAHAGVAAIEAMGAKVLALACDVTDRASLDAALERIDAELPPLRGVVHAAVALDDAAIANLDAERLRTVFAAKIAGSWNLHEATSRHQLDYFVMYSSGTTVVGNPGQANYVAANIFLESLAQYRRARGLPGLSVAWGAIKDVGILARHDGLEDLLQNRTGMSSTPSADALADLGRLMALGATRVSVAGFNIQRLGALLQGTRTPRFLPLASDSVVAALTQSGESLADLVMATPENERRELVLARLREHVGRVLGTGAGQIDPERSLQEMGLDSLMAVELAESVEQDVGQPVAVMQIIQAGSVSAVCDIVLGLIKGTTDPNEAMKIAAE